MKICILCPRYPYPEAAGDVLRVNNLAQYFRRKGYKVILVSFVDQTSDLYDSRKQIYNRIYRVRRNRLVSLINVVMALPTRKPLQNAFFYSDAFLKKTKTVIEKESPDLFIAHTGRMVQYAEKLGIRDHCIVDLADALSRTYSLADIPRFKSYKKYAYKIEQSRIRSFEKFVVDNYKKVVMVSKADKDYLGSKPSLYVYPMGVKACRSYSNDYNKNKIVFIGNMRTLQNQDAAIFFSNSVFPKLRESYPELRFYIIGAEPTKRILDLDNGKSIIVTGYVDSVEDMIKDACFSVASVRVAAGIQNKVLMAMANHIPVLLSKTISKGIPELVNGENCFIADSATEYFDYASKMIDSREVRNEIAEKGMSMIKKHYSWEAILDGYEYMED